MQAVEPYITDIPSYDNKSELSIGGQNWYGYGYPTGWTKTRVVWRIGAMKNSSTSNQVGKYTLGFTWIIATYGGRVLHRLDNLCAIELPKRYEDIIKGKL